MERIAKRIALPLLLLAACGTASAPAYLSPGTPAVQARADLAQCRAEGRTVAPARRGSLGASIGIGIGRCTGSFCIGASNRDVFGRRDEARAQARGEVVGACMGAKGYALTSLPVCRGEAQVLESHPFDTTGLCTLDGEIAAPV